jgi:hypothetical protein
MIERGHYVEMLERQRAQREEQKTHATARDFHFLTQASVAAKNLTGTAHWDLFLRYAQGAAEHTKVELAKAAQALVSPGLNADGLADLRARAIRLDERIKTIEAMITLPKDVINEGEKARSLLERLESENERRDGGTGEGAPAAGRTAGTAKRRARTKRAADAA